ncbi:AAA family ATPase [Anaerocolumna sedimenticola]|uniref:AAA family ATPase n=1 Tax=Anaerocolumna sedimenticola TaxID=2696063 RepID=A0A6P1TMA8_9FIRM|nr:AAA family ATPase [Anaerocolumna sedimenticola]QHQ60468.1 AAA family ATPase [Anaerocolumna sedimenticola]
MQLRELRLNDFGKFHNRSLRLKKGINLIYGENEAGKSTIHSFVKGMLFGIEKQRGRASKDDTYEKFLPWDNAGSYKGSLDIEISGKNIRIIRNFEKSSKNNSIIDLDTGRELQLSPEELAGLYGGLTEAGYRNTISIEQLKSRTDQDLVEEVRNYITNLSLSKSKEVDVTKALNYLQDKRKELESRQLKSKITALEKEIEEGLKKEALADKLSLQLKETAKQEKLLTQQRNSPQNNVYYNKYSSFNEYLACLEQFPIIKEKYNILKEVNQQAELLKEKLTSIEVRFHEYQGDISVALKDSINELDSLKYESKTLEEEKSAYDRKSESELNQIKKNRISISFLPGLTGAAGSLIFMGKNNLLMGLSAALLFTAILLYLLFTGRVRKMQKDIDVKNGGYEKALNSIQEKAKNILNKCGAENEKSLNLKYEEALRQEMSYEHLQKQKKEYMEQEQLLKKRAAGLEPEIMEYIRKILVPSNQNVIPFNLMDDVRMSELEEFIRKQKQEIKEKQEANTKELETIRIKKEKLKWELVTLEDNEDSLLRNQELYKELLEKKKETDLELEAIQLSIDTIQQLSIDIHDSFGRKLNDLVSNLTGEITDHKYLDIKIDEKLNIKVGYKDNYVLLNKLSAGTIEQFYFALRIAISDLVYGQGNMPILLDDCFALYDDKRTRGALTFLAEGRQGQVIIFTCHNREKDIMDELNMNYNYIDLSANS